jgi:hypothetical protein
MRRRLVNLSASRGGKNLYTSTNTNIGEATISTVARAIDTAWRLNAEVVSPCSHAAHQMPTAIHRGAHQTRNRDSSRTVTRMTRTGAMSVS